ncbi:MAG: ComEC/Rec2 family competence protein [Dehalococcoidia bacterium]
MSRALIGVLLEAVAAAFLSGVLLAALGLPLLIVPCALTAGWWYGRGSGRNATVCLMIVLCVVATSGAIDYARSGPKSGAGDISHYLNAGRLQVRGTIADDRNEQQRSVSLKLQVVQVRDSNGWRPASGKLLLHLPVFAPYDQGDTLELTGKLSPPAMLKGFDYPGYLKRQGVFAEMTFPSTRLIARHDQSNRRKVLTNLRERLAGGITSVLPEPEASLGAGIALGTRRVIPTQLNNELTRTGTAQIIVASGYNITIVALFVLSGLSWLIGRHRAALLCLPVIALYSIFVGAYPSVLRAAVMGVIAVFAALSGRPHSGLRALVLATALMIALDPQAVHDLSFLLSLSGTAGLFLFASPLQDISARLLFRSRPAEDQAPIVRAVTENLATTVAATVATQPLILWTFHTLSLASLPANALLFPAVPFIMASFAAAADSGAITSPAALVFAPAADVLLAYMVAVVHFFAAMPAGELKITWFGPPLLAVAYAGLTAIGWLCSHRHTQDRSWSFAKVPGLGQTAGLKRILRDVLGRLVALRKSQLTSLLPHRPDRALTIAFALAILVGLGGVRVLATHADTLQIRVLDVGAGDAILIEAAGSRVLINSGPPGEATVQALDRLLLPWERSLNLIVVTDPDQGHIGGLASVFQRYRIGAVLDATQSPARTARTAPLLAAWQATLLASDVQKLPAAPLTVVTLGNATLSVSQTFSERQNGMLPAATVVARLANRSFLLSGDSYGAVRADLRLVGATSESLPAYPPAVVILQAVAQARSDLAATGLPDPLRHRLVYRTQENGTVSIWTDGSALRLAASRGPRFGLFAQTK